MDCLYAYISAFRNSFIFALVHHCFVRDRSKLFYGNCISETNATSDVGKKKDELHGGDRSL